MRKKPWLILLLAALALVLAVPLALVLLFNFVPRLPALSGTAETLTLTAGGRDRTLSFYRPGGALERPALLFVLHGSNGDGGQIRWFTRYGFDQLADRERFIVVYPDGYQRHWNDCRASADYAANTEQIDDIAFFHAMIGHFTERHGVDSTRIYATGISNGGHMVYRLGYELPTTFAALAPVAANLPVDANNDCQLQHRPLSIAIFNGTEDPINPYHGGLVEIMGNASRGAVQSSMESAAYWAALAGAGVPTTRRYPELDGDADTWVELSHWQGEDGEVRLYSLHGAGHVLPMKTPGPVLALLARALGGNAGDLDGAAEIWQFFADQRAQPTPQTRPIAAELSETLTPPPASATE